jgi:hypothetical protein
MAGLTVVGPKPKTRTSTGADQLPVDMMARSDRDSEIGKSPQKNGDSSPRLSAKYRWLPPTTEIVPRGLSRHEAATLTGLSPSAFDKARREAKYPGPTLPGGRYDRILIEKAMNNFSGIDESDTPLSALDAWRTDRGARSL